VRQWEHQVYPAVDRLIARGRKAGQGMGTLAAVWGMSRGEIRDALRRVGGQRRMGTPKRTPGKPKPDGRGRR